MKRWIMALLALLLVFGLLSASAETAAEKKLTVMVYVCGSNLETLYGSASKDIDEIVNSGVDTSQVNVVVMTGGSARWWTGQDADEVQISTLRGNQLITRWHGPERSMGDPDTLRQFIDYGVENFPAEGYALILWDHGAGPLEGVCMDEMNTPDRLSIGELAEAIEESIVPGKLRWIGLDACLMSTVEVASKLAPYSEYMIASQEREPASGWDYGFLQGIEEDRDGAATGRRIIDMYMASPQKTQADLTMACVDLSEVAGIEESLDLMYSRMAESMSRENFSRIAKLRFSATGFGKGLESSAAIDGYDLVDVVSLCDCYASENDDGASRVREAVERAVVAHSENLEECCGISVYHPFRNKRGYTSGWDKAYDMLDFCPGYTDYVKTYGEIFTSQELVLWNDLKNIKAEGEPCEITLEISDEQMENLASARLVVLGRNPYDEADDSYYRVYTTADVDILGNRLSGTYSGESMQIMDETGTRTVIESVSYDVTEDGRYVLTFYPYEIDDEDREDFTVWERPIMAEYILDEKGTLDLKSYSVYDELTDAYSSRADVDLSKFSGFIFVDSTRIPTSNSAGEWLAYDAWESDNHGDAKGSTFELINGTFMPVIQTTSHWWENLYGAFEITDTQGNVYMSELTLINENEYQWVGNLGNEIPTIGMNLITSWQERRYAIILSLENVSEYEQEYDVDNLRVNGSEVAYKSTDLGRMNGYDTIAIVLDEDSFEGMSAEDVAKDITGTLHINTDYGNDESQWQHWFDFTLDAELPLDVIFHEPAEGGEPDDEIEEVDFNLYMDYYATARIMADGGQFSRRIIINVIVGNSGEENIVFGVENVRINGVATDVAEIGRDGTGSQLGEARFSLAPGERSAASIQLWDSDLSDILPDVSLREVCFDLVIAAVTDGETDIRCRVPLVIETEVPLDMFYDDASVLPSWSLVQTGKEIGTFDESTALSLLSSDDCEVMLQGLYIKDRSFVLLLRFENKSEEPWHVSLGKATLDYSDAIIGGSVDDYVRRRNIRTKTKGVDAALWEEKTGVSVDLEPGETEFRYITIEATDQDEAWEIFFWAYMYDKNNYHDRWEAFRVHILADEPAPLEVGQSLVAPASKYTDTYSMRVTSQDAPLFEADILVPEDDWSSYAMPIEFRLPEGECMQSGNYFLFRNIASDSELAALNILNTIQNKEGVGVEPVLSFDNGRQWLLAEAYGPLSVSDDGSVATANCPGLMPAIVAGGETLSLIDFGVTEGTENTFRLDMSSDHIKFRSTDLPNVLLPLEINGLSIMCDSGTRQAQLEHSGVSENMGPEELRNLAYKDVHFLPMDAEADEAMRFVNGETYNDKILSEVLQLDEPKLQLSLESMGDPEDFSVVFYYETTDGEWKCTTPKPLADYMK